MLLIEIKRIIKMYIDESTGRSIIKRNITILNKKREEIQERSYKQQIKKKRKPWLKNIVEDFTKMSFILNKEEANKWNTFFIVMVPSDDDKNLEICSVKVDKKNFFIDTKKTGIILPNHFLIRLLQFRRTNKFKDILPLIQDIINAIFNVSEDNGEVVGGDFELYLKNIGMIPFIVESENGKYKKLILKTIIGPDSLNTWRKREYDDIKHIGVREV